MLCHSLELTSYIGCGLRFLCLRERYVLYESSKTKRLNGTMKRSGVKSVMISLIELLWHSDK